MSKDTILSRMPSNISNFLVKDEIDLSKWNKCILNLECITVTTFLLTYLEQKTFFWRHTLTIQRKFNSLCHRLQHHQTLFMPCTEISWITSCLVFITAYPLAWENALQIKSVTESLCWRRRKLTWMLWIASKKTFSSTSLSFVDSYF